MDSRVHMLLQQLQIELQSESQRRGALGFIGQNTGAVMLGKNGQAVQRDAILNADGTATENDLVTFDPKTGLLLPNVDELDMLLPDGMTSVEIPKGFFVHPTTCMLMPIEGENSYCFLTLDFFRILDISFLKTLLFTNKKTGPLKSNSDSRQL